MPSGKTHDAITIILAAPTFLAALGATGNPWLACLATVTMLFGGFMFGPDLDIQSRQYTRWGIFRFLWFPYKVIFRHRSRWSHGIIFGTLIRVLYFTGMLALVVSAGVYLRAILAHGPAPSFNEIGQAWRAIEDGVRQNVGEHAIWVGLAGLWWGAASHTLTDAVWSALRKGSEIF
jgi:uncharacterized metal-binding protein